MTEPDGLDELERELSRGLRRVDAPPGLLDAVMRTAEMEGASPVRRVLRFPMRPAWIGSMAASLLLVGLMFQGVEHRRRGRAERDFARAEAITQQTMEHTREQLRQAGVVLDE